MYYILLFPAECMSLLQTYLLCFCISMLSICSGEDCMLVSWTSILLQRGLHVGFVDIHIVIERTVCWYRGHPYCYREDCMLVSWTSILLQRGLHVGIVDIQIVIESEMSSLSLPSFHPYGHLYFGSQKAKMCQF